MNLFCSKKSWILPDVDIEKIKKLCSELKISEVCAMLLLRRGICDASSARWFMNTQDLYLYDPFLLRDMDKAVERIHTALERGERICVYGDYDVDGISSTALLIKYLREKGASDVTYYIPKRLSEGYGMNKDAVKQLSECGVNLIITVDNGICANQEIDYARELGIDVVVTDHHECRGEIPDCCAVINPKRPDSEYPFIHLAGVGVAFKLICALEGGAVREEFYNRYIDLAALGTISDVMPLRDENRQIVARGLKAFENGSNAGVSALIDQALSEKNKNRDKHITTSMIGFTVAPRLNAAGRIGDVDRALEILITKEYNDCLKIADELCEKNRERQYVENKIYTEAVEIIEREHDFENDKIIVVGAEGWHHGVVGIVASKITEKYGLPSILICSEDGIGKGSARSVSGFNINEAIHNFSHLLVKHGGHELAAGLTINMENLDVFRKEINNYARERITDEMLSGSIEIDAELCGGDISLELCEEIGQFEPYGTDNPAPLFYMRDVKVRDVISLGQNKHTKLILEKDGYTFDGLYFGFCPDDFLLPESSFADFLFNLDINEFRGVRSPQIIIRDVRMCKLDAQCLAHQSKMLEDILCGMCPQYAPSIDLCRKVYVYLKNNAESFGGSINLFVLANKISKSIHISLSFPVLAVILEIFSELELIKLYKSDSAIMRVELIANAGKVDIENSSVLKKVRNA